MRVIIDRHLTTARTFQLLFLPVSWSLSGALQPRKLVKTKLLFAATTAEETVATVDAIVDGDLAVQKACARWTQRVKILFAATADETVVAIDAIMNGDYAGMKAHGRCIYRGKTKLLFFANAADETVAANDVIVDGDYTVMEARGQCGTIRSGKRKNKGFSSTNRHEGFCQSRTIFTDDYGDTDSTTSFWWMLTTFSLSCIIHLQPSGTRQAPRITQIK